MKDNGGIVIAVENQQDAIRSKARQNNKHSKVYVYRETKTNRLENDSYQF